MASKINALGITCKLMAKSRLTKILYSQKDSVYSKLLYFSNALRNTYLEGLVLAQRDGEGFPSAVRLTGDWVTDSWVGGGGYVMNG